MNLILTKECAKKCSFCFTGDYSKNTEMSIETLERILTSVNPPNVKLLGGEPTQHSDFAGVIKTLRTFKVPIVALISNLLVPSSTLSEFYTLSGPLSILANGMELDEKNRMKLFKKNWEAIPKKVRKTLALTLDEHSTLEGLEGYIGFLKEHLGGSIERTRIGLDLSGPYLINNKKVGDIILRIQELLPSSAILFDCQIPLCIFSYDFKEKLNLPKESDHICSSMALDVFHDGTSIYCYQAPQIGSQKLAWEYGSLDEISNELEGKYSEVFNKKPIHKSCIGCSFYTVGLCNGLCLGCHTEPAEGIPLETV